MENLGNIDAAVGVRVNAGRRVMVWLLVGLLVQLPVLVGHPLAAVAAEAGADPRQDEARRECLAGRYQRGIDILATLFTETRHPNHLFNQARCFQQNNRPVEAIGRFREYLRKAQDLSASEAAEVQKYIDECEAMKSAEAAESATAAGAAPAPTPTADAQLRERVEVHDDLRARHFRIAGIACAAVGVVALGFGGFMGYRTMTLQSDFEKQQKDHPGYFDRNAYNSGQRAEVFQWVGYGVGAVAVGTGAIFYYLGYSERERAQTVSLVPALSGRGMGADLQWRF